MKWSEYKLANLTEKFISGGTPSTKVDDYWHGNIPWITGADFTDEDIILGRRYINEDAIKNSSTNIVPKGSIIMVTRTGVGKIAIAQKDMAISQDITGIILKNGINTSYIVAAIKNKMATLLSAQRGATIKGITRKDVENLVLSTPSPSEQRKIVEILDQADRLRKLRAEADKRSERILPALFIKMFGDPATNLMGWSVKAIRSFVEQIKRHDPRNDPESAFAYIDIAGVDGKQGTIVEAKQIKGEDAPSRARQIVHTNDVIVSTVRPYLRATALVPKELNLQICSTGFCVLRSNNQCGFGFLYALSRMQWFTDQLNALARGASYPAVTDSDILSIKVPMPNNTEIYQSFDNQVINFLQLRVAKDKSANILDMLFSAILHRAFTGDLTASWRQTHMKELLQEMEIQARALAG